jgi:hypothetical protein
MTTCRLTVRVPEGVWQGEVDSWTGWVVLAALSAEPESLAELAEALRRYRPEHGLLDRPRPAPEHDEAAAGGPWCLIDLVGRAVVAGGGYELPEPCGAYEADEDDHAEGFPVIWLTTPDDWLFRQASDDWRAVVAARAAARAAVPRLDARAVLFGRPLLEHLAHGVLAAGADGVVEEERRHELTRAVHAGWLLTPRADLGGRTPRDMLLADRERLSLDLDRRAEQWSLQGRPAPALPPDSAAYRFGGFGTMEVVLYFDLVRALLAEAWRLTGQEPCPAEPALVERLTEFRDGWLQELHAESGPPFLSPAELIQSERRRMPVTGDGSHLDCDCPLCQAMADGEFGPYFMCFDGHHLELEDEFAFSLCRTREEWEKDQEEHRKFSEEMDRKHAERAAAGEDADDPLTGSVWQTSFVDWDSVAGPDAPPEAALLALGCPLAELVSAQRDRPDGMNLMRSLNGAYAGLRAGADEAVAEAAAQEFRDLLEAAARTFPDLTPRCADLQSRLDEILRRVL